MSREIENSGKWGKVGSYGYNLAMSMGDFLYTSAITGGMEPLALTVMGTEAAADSVLAAKERGLSDERSFIIGTAAGLIEALTEKMQFDTLFKADIRGLGKKGFGKYIQRNAGAEAAEEGTSDLLNWITDDLYDLVTGTKESEFKELVAAYEENGLDHTKALLSALGDRGKELGLDTLGGALSGLFLSEAKSGYNAVQFNRMGQEALDTGSYQDYISLGLLADHDTEAYRYAEEIQAKLNAGRAVSNIEMGQLTAAVYADALGVGEKRSTEVREEPDEELWDRVFDEEDDDETLEPEKALTENQLEDIVEARLRAIQDAEDTSSRIEIAENNPPIHIGEVDFNDNEAVTSVFQNAEQDCLDLPYEVNTTITTDGKVWRTSGEAGYVNPFDIPVDLTGAYSYHNHPAEKTHYSLSAEDVRCFFEVRQSVSKASDPWFEYQMTRTAETLDVDKDWAFSRFNEIRKTEVRYLAFQGLIDPDFDEYHATMMILSKELKFKYERKAKHK